MNKLQQLDRFQLQRLIDGELDEESRIHFLRDCDEDVAHWRTVALAFVEDQLLRTTIRNEKAMMSTVTVPVSDCEQGRSGLRSSVERAEARLGGWKNFLAIAASISLLLVGYWIGGRISSNQRISSDRDVGSNREVASVQPSAHAEPVRSLEETAGQEWKRAGTLQFVGIPQREGSPAEIPVFDYPQIESRLLGHSVEDLKQIESNLRRYGLTLDYQIEMLEGQLPDGRRVVVPVKNVGLRTYGQ